MTGARARGPNGSRAHSHNPLVRYLKVLGPGLVTGASDDDPGGIATYAIAGARFGYATLWTAPLTLPLAMAVQLVCARIGLVTGRGLAGALRRHYPRPFVYLACLLLLIANVFNIAADLAGMADAAAMVTGGPSLPFIFVFGIFTIAVTVYTRYATFARYLKWLTLVLFAYIVAAVLARPSWSDALRATVIPTIHWDVDFVGTLVAILGTTISPYLFFWQASQEVEDERAHGRTTVAARRGVTAHELADARIDVTTGICLANAVFYFIIVATAATLHRAGFLGIASTREAAEALRPLAGDAAYLLFALGLIGAGLLAVPVLAGSASYAISEGFGWRSGLDLSPRQGRRFYLVLAAAIIAGMLLDLFQMNAVHMLFVSAVLNGLLAPPLLVLVMLVGSNPHIMGEHVSPPWMRAVGWTATVVMGLAAVALGVSAVS